MSKVIPAIPEKQEFSLQKRMGSDVLFFSTSRNRSGIGFKRCAIPDRFRSEALRGKRK